MNTIDRIALLKEAMQKADAKKRDDRRRSSNYASRTIIEAQRVSKTTSRFSFDIEPGGEP